MKWIRLALVAAGLVAAIVPTTMATAARLAQARAGGYGLFFAVPPVGQR